jgi:hypothetical protein
MEGIDYPTGNDVMLGRGGGTNTHMGNIHFRQLVREHKHSYITASKAEKPKVAMLVVQAWRALEPPGRFLAKSDPSMGDDSYWHDVGDKEARKKASQCLRERTPEVLPLIKSCNEKEAEKKEADNTAEKEEKHETKDPPNRDSRTKADKEATVEVTLCRIVSDEMESAADVPSVVTSTERARWALFKGFKEKNTRNIRQEVSYSIPSAASLVRELFEDFREEDINDDELNDHDLQGSDTSLSWYPEGYQELPVPSVGGNDATSIDTDPSSMERLSTSTWLSTFRSTENSGHRTFASMQETLDNEKDCDDTSNVSALDLAVPPTPLDRMACLHKMKLAKTQISNFSMLSDLTGDSSNGRRGSARSLKMRNARGSSTLSMLSELTDMSDSMRGIDLAM